MKYNRQIKNENKSNFFEKVKLSRLIERKTIALEMRDTTTHPSH